MTVGLRDQGLQYSNSARLRHATLNSGTVNGAQVAAQRVSVFLEHTAAVLVTLD